MSKGAFLPNRSGGLLSAPPRADSRSFSPLFLDSPSFEASLGRVVRPLGQVLGDQKRRRCGDPVPFASAPSQGGTAWAEVRVSGAQMSLVEIRACPCPGFLQMNAETPPVPGSPEPPYSERSRAGGRKDCRELRSQESKGGDWRRGTRDLETQRDSDSEPHGSWSSVRGRASPWTLPKAGNEFVSFSARSGSDFAWSTFGNSWAKLPAFPRSYLQTDIPLG